MFVVDTNLLLYAVNPDAAEHRQARALLTAWREGEEPWFVTWGIIYEFLRVSTHPKVFPKPLSVRVAREWIATAIASASAGILLETERHADILADIIADHPRLGGNVVHDVHIAALMKESGISEIRTLDTDFHQFKFLDVVNPLRDAR